MLQKRILLLFVTLIVCHSISFANSGILYTADHDLPNSLTNQVAESADGNIWIATEIGLVRFNGSSFRTYYHKYGDARSLASNFVRTVCTDKLGHLIVGTTAGVQAYCPTTDDFTPILINKEAGVPKSGNISGSFLVKDGEFIVGGQNIFTIIFDKNNTPVIHGNKATGKRFHPNSCYVDDMGTMWFSCLFEGVYSVDRRGNIVKGRDANGRFCQFQTILQGPDGRIYGSDINGGLYVKNANGYFSLIKGTEFLPCIRDMKTMPGTKTMCLATDGAGLRFYDCSSGTLSSNLIADPFVDLSTQKIHSLSFSSDGDLWMAMYQKGVYVNITNAPKFNYIGPRSSQFNSIGNKCVTSMLQSHDGNIWVSTDNGGIYGFNPDGYGIASYPCNGNVPLAPLGLFEDSKNRVWFGSYGSGYGQINLSTGKCTYFPIKGIDDAKTNIYAFAEDKRGRVWAAAMGNGLLCFNEATQQMEIMSSSEYLNWSCSLFYDAKFDRLFVGTYGSFEVIDLSAKAPFKSVTHLFQEDVIHSISPYGSGKIAVSTSNGLYICDISKKEKIDFLKNDIITSTTVYAALEGMNGSIWISTTEGLTHVGTQATSYTILDGLQGNEFYKNAMLKTKDGRLYFGGQNGITWFDPTEVHGPSQTCTVGVVGFKTGLDHFMSPDKYGNYHLSRGDRSFSFELIVRPMSMMRRVIYKYQMDDGGWLTLPTMHNQLSYSSLSPGNHTFEVCAVIDGRNSEITKVNIYIEYPWYRQWWAWILWIALAASISWYIYRQWRIRRKQKQRVRESEMAEAAQEERLQFFINVAHDLRTPMTLIVSPLQKLITTDPDSQHQHIYGMMQRNANRILNLVNQLMDVRKIDRGKMVLRCQKVMFSPFIRNIVASVKDLAETKHQTLTYGEGTCDEQQAWLDPDFLEKILLNLLGNSVKYTPDDGNINVEWHTADGNLILSVSDDGIGIPKEEQQYIFGRFYQIKGSSQIAKGTGIGLNLVQSLVTLHHGTIEVADGKDGKGSRFTVTLPIEETAYAEEEKSYVITPIEELIPDTVPVTIDTQENCPPTVKSNAPTLLVVDDEADIRQYLCDELSDTYNILMCSNGEEALAVILREKVDLVLSDVMMPVMDGMQLVANIRKNVHINHLPIILLTAKNTDKDRIESLKLNVEAFIGKPFNVEVLRSTISSILRRRAYLRNAFNGNQMPAEKIDTPEVKSPDERLLERVIKVINDNLSNPDITSEDIAREVGLSRVHLYRKLLELTNQTASNYIRNIRLTKAAELLKQGKMSISEIAYEVGFKTPNHFSTAFKKVYGMPPSDFMKNDE